MNQNLQTITEKTLPIPSLRPDRPASLLNSLYPLEKESKEGRILETKYAVSALADYPEIDPSAFNASYFDKTSGLTLPVFAAFNLKGKPEISIVVNNSEEKNEEIVKAWQRGGTENSLLGLLPLQSIKDSHLQREHPRSMPFVAAAWIGWAIVTFFVILLFHAKSPVKEFPIEEFPIEVLPIGLASILVLVPFIKFLVGFVDHSAVSARILTLTGRFSGLLPQDIREKAQSAQSDFSNLYLVVDQQNHWEASYAPAPLPRIDLDPLLVGSKNINGVNRYFLIATFELTMAEDYIRQEFTT